MKQMSEYMYPGYIKTDDIVKYCDEMSKKYELTNPSYSDACSDMGNKCLDLSNDDVVEVVRCKDCRFYDSKRTAGLNGYCEVCKCYKEADGFCNCGEQGENE